LYHGFETAEIGGAARVIADLKKVWFGEVSAGCGKWRRKCDVGKIDKRAPMQGSWGGINGVSC